MKARQKRITFDNTHYRVDLVFYHRILKCHVLIDLKMEPFSHADAGQMNVYLNYYRENEMCDGDNLPVGVILCADKNETLVRYATTELALRQHRNQPLDHRPQFHALQYPRLGAPVLQHRFLMRTYTHLTSVDR